MKAGFAEIVITPKEGKCFLAGYGGPWSTGVHDDLYASAVYLEEGNAKAIVVSFDLIGMRADLVARMKDCVQRGVDVDRNNIFTTCTHTHEGPDTIGLGGHGFGEDERQRDSRNEYLTFLEGQVESVAREAVSAARECELMVNRAFVDENMNRRFFMPNGDNYFIPSYKDLMPVAHGHTDRELGMVYFCPVGDRHPYGMIVNYTMHPLTAGNTTTLISADVPGVVRDLVWEGLQCKTCYITGAAGDNHPKRPEGGFAETRRVGGVLATEAITRRFDAAKLEGPLKLKCLTRSVRLHKRTREDFESIALYHKFEDRIEGYLKFVGDPGAPIDVEFSLLGIGPLLFIGVPGELVAELGSMLKWSSPFQRTYIMYAATDFLGYIAHPNAYKWGGYEANAGLLSPASVKPLIDAIIEAAGELAAS